MSPYELLGAYLDACAMFDRTRAESKLWGDPKALLPEQRLFLKGIEELARTRMHELRYDLAKHLDDALLPTHEYEAGLEFFHLPDELKVRRLQQIADQEGCSAVAVKENGARDGTVVMPTRRPYRIAEVLKPSTAADGRRESKRIGFVAPPSAPSP